MVLRKLQYFFTQVWVRTAFLTGPDPNFSVSSRLERKGKELYLSVLSSSTEALIGDTVN